MGGRLRPDYQNSVTLTGTTARLSLNHYDTSVVWVFEQITANYNVVTDNPLVSIVKDGIVYAAPGIMLPGAINSSGMVTGLSSTFSGLPYLILESANDGEVILTNGSIGAVFSIIGQKYHLGYDSPELQGR